MTAATVQDIPLGRHPAEDRAIRVLFIADHLGHANGRIHGGTTYFLNTMPALRAADFEVDVVFLGPRHPMARRLEADGFPSRFLGHAKYDLRSIGATREIATAKDYDVVHLHSFKSHLLGRLAVRGRPVATVVHVHDQIEMAQPLRFVQGLLGPSTSALIGVSDSVTQFGRKQYNVPASRCRTIPNGIKLAPFLSARGRARMTVRDELGVPPERPVLLVAGRLNPVKGHPQLFEAMRIVAEAGPDCELWVVGDGGARADYETTVRSFGLDGIVRFLGQREDMPEIFGAADIALVPSMWEEGFGLVALEASATGLPVIAFNTGGLAALVHDGRSGLLLPRGDSAALAEAILRLLGDAALRERLGDGAREVARGFTIERHVAALAEVYRDVVAPRGGG